MKNKKLCNRAADMVVAFTHVLVRCHENHYIPSPFLPPLSSRERALDPIRCAPQKNVADYSIFSQSYFMVCHFEINSLSAGNWEWNENNILHCCFRRLHCMGSSQFERRWCTLDGSSAWALQKSMNGCSFFSTSLICQVRTDLWRISGMHRFVILRGIIVLTFVILWQF